MSIQNKQILRWSIFLCTIYYSILGLYFAISGNNLVNTPEVLRWFDGIPMVLYIIAYIKVFRIEYPPSISFTAFIVLSIYGFTFMTIALAFTTILLFGGAAILCVFIKLCRLKASKRVFSYLDKVFKPIFSYLNVEKN